WARKHGQWCGEEDGIRGYGDARGNHIQPQRDATAWRVDRQGNPEKRQSKKQTRSDRQNNQPCINQTCTSQMNATSDEVESAIEKMRSGHQDHARTDRNKAQR